MASEATHDKKVTLAEALIQDHLNQYGTDKAGYDDLVAKNKDVLEYNKKTATDEFKRLLEAVRQHRAETNYDCDRFYCVGAEASALFHWHEHHSANTIANYEMMIRAAMDYILGTEEEITDILLAHKESLDKEEGLGIPADYAESAE